MESSRRFSLILIPILALGLILFRACKSESSGSAPQALLAEADSLQNQVQSAWASLLQADDQMQYNLNSAVQVLIAEEVIDSTQQDSLAKAVENLGPLRRDMETMKTEAIDSYDMAWYELMDHIQNLPGNSPSPAVTNIFMALDEFATIQLLSLRTEYDQAARNYNAWYQKNKKDLSSAELPARYPLFALQE